MFALEYTPAAYENVHVLVNFFSFETRSSSTGSSSGTSATIIVRRGRLTGTFFIFDPCSGSRERKFESPSACVGTLRLPGKPRRKSNFASGTFESESRGSDGGDEVLPTIYRRV